MWHCLNQTAMTSIPSSYDRLSKDMVGKKSLAKLAINPLVFVLCPIKLFIRIKPKNISSQGVKL